MGVGCGGGGVGKPGGTGNAGRTRLRGGDAFRPGDIPAGPAGAFGEAWGFAGKTFSAAGVGGLAGSGGGGGGVSSGAGSSGSGSGSDGVNRRPGGFAPGRDELALDAPEEVDAPVTRSFSTRVAVASRMSA